MRSAPPRRKQSAIAAFLLWTTVTIAALAVAAATFLFVAAPTNLVRDQLIQQVRERTGRDLHIAGRTSLSFVPEFGVTLERVSLAAPPSMGGDPVLRIAEVTAKVPLLSLLRGEVRIERLVLHHPELILRVDAEGRRTWDFAQADPEIRLPRPVFAQMGAPSVKSLAQSLSLSSVRIQDASVSYVDEQKGIQEDIRDISLEFAVPSLSNPVEVKGDLVWRRERMKVAARLASPKALASGAPSPLVLQLSGRSIDIKYDGSISPRDQAVTGAVTANAQRTQTLASWLGISMPDDKGGGPFSLTGTLKSGAGVTELIDADVTVDGQRFTGTVAFDRWVGRRPRVRADIRFSELDINRWLRPEEAAPKRQSRSRDGQGTSDGSTQSIDDLLKREEGSSSSGKRKSEVRGYSARHGWSEVDFDFSGFGHFDGDLKLAVDHVLFRNVRTGPARITAVLDKRVLTARIDDVQLYDGQGVGIMRLDASKPEATVQTNLQFEGVTALHFLKDAADFDWVSGKGKVVIAVAGRGRSERQMIETLTGDAQFAFRDGALVGYNISGIIRGLQQGRMPTLERNLSDRTDFSEMQATFKIASGIAENRDLRLISQVLHVTGGGRADLPKRMLDYTVRPKLVVASTGSSAQQGLELPVRITGSWDKPDLTPDFNAVLKDPNQVVETAKEIGRQLKGKDVNEVVRNLLGSDGDPDDTKTKKKARDFLRQFAKPD